eukprot:1027931-Alexandrium_andersonii.AAC.1
MPRPAEKGFLLRRAEDEGIVYLSLLTDVKRARHLVKIKESEWGMPACELEGVIYANTVGMFGISSAAK